MPSERDLKIAEAVRDAVFDVMHDASPSYVGVCNSIDLQAILAAIPAASEPVAVPDGWKHAANEWADVACNGLDWLRNVRDGVSTPDEGIANMEQCIANCRDMQPAAAPQPEAQQPERECPICNGTGYNSYPLSDGGYIGGRCACTAKKKSKQPEQALTDFDIVTMANRIIDYSFICDGGGPTELASDEARQAGLIEFARALLAAK